MAENTVTIGIDVTRDLGLLFERLQELQEEGRRQALMLAADVVRKQLSRVGAGVGMSPRFHGPSMRRMAIHFHHNERSCA